MRPPYSGIGNRGYRNSILFSRTKTIDTEIKKSDFKTIVSEVEIKNRILIINSKTNKEIFNLKNVDNIKKIGDGILRVVMSDRVYHLDYSIIYGYRNKTSLDNHLKRLEKEITINIF